jgi:hypothetical protein
MALAAPGVRAGSKVAVGGRSVTDTEEEVKVKVKVRVKGAETGGEK